MFRRCDEHLPSDRSLSLRPALRRATDAFLESLDEFTLADISDNGDEILDILSLAPSPAAECVKIRATH